LVVGPKLDRIPPHKKNAVQVAPPNESVQLINTVWDIPAARPEFNSD